MKAYITNFKQYTEDYSVDQVEASNWLMKYQEADTIDNFEKYMVSPKKIGARHFYAKGIARLPYKGDALYNENLTIQPSLNTRSIHAQEKIEEIFHKLYKEQVPERPNHINHVTCTHYQSPSAAQKIVVKKDWVESTPVTHLYHMGCYAALPAIRVSKSYVSDGARLVDVVHTELCSFHLDKENTTPEQTIMNTLFADGAIKYSVSNERYFTDNKIHGFEIIAQKEQVVPGTEDEMHWKLGANGFLMTLTKNVPIVLAKKINTYMRNLFDQAGLDFERDKSNVIFAVHPGGPKIIDLVSRMLKLEDRQIEHSNTVLRTRGNMSSATVPHIWNEILVDDNIADGTFVATVAFGPGLTITGAILKLCRH
jgi:predicted naringenin-chalcone synthase